MKPKTERIGKRTIAGINVRTINKNESDPETGKIPGLWGEFYQRNLMETIPHQVSGSMVYGVYWSYESDVNGYYTITAGREVTPDSQASGEFPRVEIQAGNYLVFEGRGNMPDVVIEAWGRVWQYFSDQTEYQRAYTTDFELYTGEDSVAIYIAVK